MGDPQWPPPPPHSQPPPQSQPPSGPWGEPSQWGQSPPAGQPPGWGQPQQWGQPQPAGPPQQWGQPGSAAGSGWGGPPPAAKPGIIPLRPLLLGEILDGAVGLVRQAPRVVLGLSAGVAIVGQLLTLALQLSTLRNGLGDNLSGQSISIGFGGASGLVGFVVTALLQLVLAGMLTVVASELVLGRDVTLTSTWERIRPLLWKLLVGASLAALLPFVGLVALLVGGVFLWVTLALTTPALVLERLGPLPAMRRSFRLALPDFWRVLGIRLLAFLIAGLIASVITLPVAVVVAAVVGFGVVGTGTGTVLLLGATSIAGIVASTITAPFSAGVDALLYIDRRMRAEGLDIRLRDAAQAQARSAEAG